MSDSKANIAIIGTGPGTYSLISLDLKDIETALALGSKIARDTGRRVTVRDEQGIALEVFEPPATT
jgi:hypothetical protein